MRLMTFAALSLFITQQSLTTDTEKNLFCSILNHQNQSVFLQCHVLYPTGEKVEKKIEKNIPRGRLERFGNFPLNANCTESAIVMCKVKKEIDSPSIAHFRLSIPCDVIQSHCSLELEASKDTLKGLYPCNSHLIKNISDKKPDKLRKSVYYSLWHHVVKL